MAEDIYAARLKNAASRCFTTIAMSGRALFAEMDLTGLPW
jgi:hypothetical protein